MDQMDNNKGTPTKRTSLRNDINFENFNTSTDFIPEVEQPNPANSTPSIPEEMPARDYK